jgi:hypothetical protein
MQQLQQPQQDSKICHLFPNFMILFSHFFRYFNSHNCPAPPASKTLFSLLFFPALPRTPYRQMKLALQIFMAQSLQLLQIN